jgi:hypothetical protein
MVSGRCDTGATCAPNDDPPSRPASTNDTFATDFQNSTRIALCS